MEWKAHAIRRRCQLRLARSFLLGRKRRRLRAAFAAWRDGRRVRAQVARALARVARAVKSVMLRRGMRRLAAAARRHEREEAVSVSRDGRRGRRGDLAKCPPTCRWIRVELRHNIDSRISVINQTQVARARAIFPTSVPKQFAEYMCPFEEWKRGGGGRIGVSFLRRVRFE